jgi:hypothetical protein
MKHSLRLLPPEKYRALSFLRNVLLCTVLLEFWRIMGRKHWRKRVGVEPTDDGVTRHPPVLKTGTITGSYALPEKNEKTDRAAG